MLDNKVDVHLGSLACVTIMRGVLWVVILALASGCVSDAVESAGGDLLAERPRPVVIALLDSGGSPYQEILRADYDALISELGIEGLVGVTLSAEGPARERLERDAAALSSLTARTPYHFTGTRLIAISFVDDTGTYPQTLDGDRHGVATSYLAAREAPEAVIVMVQIDGAICGADVIECESRASIADGMEWVAAQPWIDIVSVSLGAAANLPDASDLHPEARRYRAASEAAVRSGKIVVNGAGNTVAPVLAHYYNGPPWVISVGGVERDAQGEAVLASKVVDVVSNFSDIVPLHEWLDMGWRSGTSLATPIVAGTLANALQIVRAADPDRVVAPGEVRDALNATAVYFETSAWDPRPPGRIPLPYDAVQYLSLPIATQAQMGWGYVNASLAPEIARRVLEHDLAPPASKGQAMLFQPAWQQGREEFWARYGR